MVLNDVVDDLATGPRRFIAAEWDEENFEVRRHAVEAGFAAAFTSAADLMARLARVAQASPPSA